MKGLLFTLITVIFAIGCARVSVQGSKEPIKLDISMRLDIYQHVEKDIDAIESMVSGGTENAKPADTQSFMRLFLDSAYAQEGLGPEVEQAALRRKDRVNELRLLESQGIIGENKSGLVEARDPQAVTAEARQLINAENSDRMVIYKSVAAKNNTSVEEVEKLYAKRLQSDAPSGTLIEVFDQSSGAYLWKEK
ncbi:MAG: YdbL family protein [Candidatus Omnitrophica bacterium]|nr:YdbL family protein [Candidatus Omnitrophota bacterium]MBU1869480.1 YdbL family protein [Candidatus Omnitrophota bacterium]